MPALASHRNTTRSEPVNSSEGEAFGFTIVPAQASEYSDVLCDLLLDVNPKAVLHSSRAWRGRDVRNTIALFCYLDCFPISSGIRVVHVFKQPHSARMCPQHVPV